MREEETDKAWNCDLIETEAMICGYSVSAGTLAKKQSEMVRNKIDIIMMIGEVGLSMKQASRPQQ